MTSGRRRGKTGVRRFAFPAGVAVLAGVMAWSGCGEEVGAGDSASLRGGAPKPPVAAPRRVELVWPTPNRAYADGADIAAYVQPTASGVPTSGLYGSVRSGGRQFHEGLDLFPLERDRNGEAIDPVFAVMRGVVRHVNRKAGASNYGRYLVLEHPDESPPVYTLYAHLADVAPGVAVGAEVTAGQTLGRMGRSASGEGIPKSRAHLHFEIGVRLTDGFDRWYRAGGFGSPNEQGLYNGMNLLGLDPKEFFARARSGGLASLDVVFRALPTAVRVRVAATGAPDFALRYPSLVEKAPNGVSAGWEIDFSSSGVPLRWRRPADESFAGWRRGEARVVFHDDALLAANRGRDLVEKRKGMAVPGDDLDKVLDLLFARSA